MEDVQAMIATLEMVHANPTLPKMRGPDAFPRIKELAVQSFAHASH